MVTQNNIFAAFLTISWVLLFLISSELLAHKEKLSKENARKMIHISVGNVIFFIPLYEDMLLAAIIPFTFVFGNYLLSPNSPIEKIRLKTFQAGHSNGTIYYPLSLTIVVIIYFNEPQLLLTAFFPLVYGDGLAAVIGPQSKSKEFQTLGGTKTVSGTMALFLGSLISVFVGNLILGIYVSNPISTNYLLMITTIAAIMGTVFELISPKGFDNLVIPLGLTIVIYFL